MDVSRDLSIERWAGINANEIDRFKITAILILFIINAIQDQPTCGCPMNIDIFTGILQ